MKISTPFIVKILNKQDLHPLQAASNQSGNKLQDVTIKQDYTFTPPKRGALVVHNELILPQKDSPQYIHLPEFLKIKRTIHPDVVRNTRNLLWIKVNTKEKRENSQYARQFELALSPEIPLEDAVTIVQTFAMDELIGKGMVVDFAIHENQVKNKDAPPEVIERTAFLMCTTRPYSHGEFTSKPREWNDRGQFMAWRSAWFAHLQKEISAHKTVHFVVKHCIDILLYILCENKRFSAW